MVSNPPENTPRISPYLLYEDAGAALEWLAAAFGFKERSRVAGEDGTVFHAEMELQDGVIMLGHPGPEFESPKKKGYLHGYPHIYVDDVDAHYEHAKAAGAKIVEEPKDEFYGDRRYSAEDPEGHRWFFAEHVRDVPPEEMHP